MFGIINAKLSQSVTNAAGNGYANTPCEGVIGNNNKILRR